MKGSSNSVDLELPARVMQAILCPPFEWCSVKGGKVVIEDASADGGTIGGTYQVAGFAMSKYLITNAQYARFIAHPHGFPNVQWWQYSPEAARWRQDHPQPKPTAFPGTDLPRTRVSWFDAMAFCKWLSAELKKRTPELQDKPAWLVRLPTEQEWQRAAVAHSGWRFPWGDQLEATRANYGRQVGCPTPVTNYPGGKSPYGVMDMVGNVWEWCLTPWGNEIEDASGYIHRHIKGGAWNVSNPEYLRASGRCGHPPRGMLNDCGFRCVVAEAKGP